MSIAHLGLRFAQRFVPRSRSGTAVLAYHLVGADTRAVVDVPLPEFRRQLDWLKAECEVVTLEEALCSPGSGRQRVVLTFDDAYRNFLDRAWPELALRNLPSLLYVPVGFVRGTSPPPLRGADLGALTFAELRELSGSGVTIGSHGVTHANLRRLPPEAVIDELRESRTVLEQEVETTVDSFCYPQAKLSPEVALLTALHYRTAVTAGGRPFAGDSLNRIPRFPIRRGQLDFAEMVRSRLWLSELVAHRLRQFRA